MANNNSNRLPAGGSATGSHSTPAGVGLAPADGMLTKKDLAARLRVTLRTIENWQRAGYLPFIKISNVVLFHWPDVLDHLNTHFKVQRRGAMSPRLNR